MSWLTRSIAATLSGEPDPDSDASESEEPITPSRGVKDDISELTETLTRRLWGVASFLAPPPPPPEPESSSPRAAPAEADDGEGGDVDVDGDGIAGIRSDLAEIGGRVRSGISMLQSNLAVAEISKIASSLLPFGEEEPDEGEPVAGGTEEVLVFVKHISTRPETWLDFPLFISERYADDFELSNAQYVHALSMEHLVPSLSDLKVQICSTDMSEACFWKIYFVLLHSKLNKQDAELLSTPQILEAREELLQSLQAKNKRGSETTRESSENANESSAPAEEKVIEPSIIQDKEVSISEVRSFEEPTSDITPEIEPEKFPVSTTEVEIIDKSVIEEELLSVKDKIRAPLVQSRLHADTDEDEVDEWPDNDSTEEPEAVAAASNRASLGREEDVSFSDLEDDDDDDDGNKGSGK
ncbi:unnamed protein product [Triticum turgidum subsp. durum]|uniref:BSD domain-containing protein n=1 Tax=Triticum turgidum subsp. durum TaxID=4567 RepID=A0A9R0QGK7_TRITD|nr:unnamed protein product [Triticum turgidum subsp. durum]